MVDFRITVLVEDTAGGRGLLAEHGLSFWIEWGQKRILFDTGQGYALKHNAQALGLQLETLGDIVLSHGHYDHNGGLPDALALAHRPRVYVHPQAFAPKFGQNADGSARNVGMPDSTTQALRTHDRLGCVDKPTEIGEGLWCTGPIPRTNDYEDTGGTFFKDESCRQPDDLAIFLETRTGTVVILGCAHAGVINTLHYIRALTENSPIHAVVGGDAFTSCKSEADGDDGRGVAPTGCQAADAVPLHRIRGRGMAMAGIPRLL